MNMTIILPLRCRRVAGLLTALVVLVSAPPAVFGQTAALVRGAVATYQANGSAVPLSGAEVVVQRSGSGDGPRRTLTSSGGMYYFADLPAGMYEIRVAASNRESRTFDVEVRPVPVFDVPPILLPSSDNSYIAAFRNGVIASDQRRWEEAVRHLQSALILQPPGGPAVKQALIYNVRIERYAPYFWLARALARKGDCAAAQAALARAAAEVPSSALRQRQTEVARCKSGAA